MTSSVGLVRPNSLPKLGPAKLEQHAEALASRYSGKHNSRRSFL